MTEQTKPCPLPLPMLDADEYRRRRQLIKDWIERVLEPGIDYGEGRGKTDLNASEEDRKKWSMLKPGGQKITDGFSLRSQDRVTYRELAWNGATGRIYFEVECTILDADGQVLATRTGVCSTDEEKYRSVWKTEYELKDAGLTPEGRQSKQAQRKGKWVTIYRVDNPNIGDLVRTVQAMASKRAFIEAVEAALALGSIFAEDDEPESTGRQEEQTENGNRQPDERRADAAHSETPTRTAQPPLGAPVKPAEPPKPAEPAPNSHRVETVRESLERAGSGEMTEHKCEHPGCGKILPPAVVNYCERYFDGKYCTDHQKLHQRKAQAIGGGY